MKNAFLRTQVSNLIVIASLSLAPVVLAVDPPPDGGYPNQNTAEGEDALFSLLTGQRNTAIGFNALFKNTAGNGNTAVGMSALYNNTTGGGNIALGENALALNTTGLYNTAIGGSALLSNTVANFNTATGYVALALNTTGINNTAEGYGALYNNTTGNYNTASGQGSLQGNSTGRNNTAIGQNALARNTIGSNNIAVGSNAGSSLTTGSNNIDIFERGVAGESNTIRIGRVGIHTATYVAGISGITVAGGVGVVIDTDGHLGTIVSSARYKDNIQPMSKSSETILSLKPVTFRYKKELDPKAIPQFGLVAEDVAKIDPDLVARDNEGKPYTVRYEAVNAMLLNEFLKEHRKVEEQATENQEQAATITQLKSAVAQQQSANAEQQKAIAALTATLKAQAAQIQKVNDQLRVQAPAPRVVAND
jgi:hypothetical protein